VRDARLGELVALDVPPKPGVERHRGELRVAHHPVQAELAEGGQLDDPAAFVGRLNKLMLGLFMAGG